MNQRLKPELDYDWLLSRARNPHDAPSRAFAGVIVSASRGNINPPGFCMGLDRTGFAELLARYFPQASSLLCDVMAAQSAPVPDGAPRSDEFDDLLNLFLEHRSDDSDQTGWLAYAFCSGCMGHDHLYVDMGLPNRAAVSGLLQRHFNALYCKNVGAAMKWKKFFYKQLCERAEVQLCPAPSCQVCDEKRNCFSPETASGYVVEAAV